MAYFADGTPYAYHHSGSTPASLNVGWLCSEHPHPTGAVPPEFVRRLIVLSRSPVNLMRGYHDCDLCPSRDSGPPAALDPSRPIGEQLEHPSPLAECRFEGEEFTVGGNGEIRVAQPDGTRWTAPRLIVHYVLAHHYRPPAGFIDAVLHGSVLPDPQRRS